MNLIKVGILIFLNTIAPNCYCDESQFSKKNKSSSNKSISADDTAMLLLLKKKFEKSKNTSQFEYADVLVRIAKFEANNLNYQKSNQLFFKAFQIYHTRKSDKTLDCLIQIADNFKITNQYESALKYYELIASLAPKYTNNFNVISNAYHEQSFIYFNTGDYQKALDRINVAVVYSKKANDKFMEALALKDKSKTLLQLGETIEAEKIVDQALFLVKNEKPAVEIGLIYQAKGYVFRQKKEIDKALEFFFKAAKLYKNLNANVDFSLVGIDIGLMYYIKHEYLKSIKYSNDALEAKPNNFSKVQLNDNIGGAYYEIGNYEKALFHFQNALTTSDYFKFSNKDFTKLPSSKLLKNIDKKRTFLIVLSDKALCWLDYAKATKNNKQRLDYALQTYKLIDNLIDYMRHEHSGNQSKFFWRKNTRPIYESAIETCLLLKDYEKAFYFFEKSRSVMLNDKLNEMGAKQKLSEADQKKEKEFISKILELNASIEKEKDAKKVEILKTNLSDLVEVQSQFTKKLETTNPAYYQMKYDTNTVSLKQMQSYLKANFKGKPATIVEYFMGNSATYALVVSADKAEIKNLKYDKKLLDTFLSLSSQKLNTKTELDSLGKISFTLNNQLIKPLNIPKGHLIISQDGSFLTFEALAKSNKTGDYIIKDYAISYTYSAQFLLKNKSENSFSLNKNFIGFAPVNFPDLASLNGSKKSISNLADHYFLNKKLVEKEASKSNFLSQANSYKIVQLYTHALADSMDTEPRIYFADTTLKVSELSAENRFKTQLLVLSACKTGVGKLAKGEGILSLARGFSMLGIPATITSLWSVEDADIYKITEFFYNYLNKGFGKDEALQMAKNEFISQSENPQPYSWAGMVLVGETASIGNSQVYLWIIGSIIILGLLIFWLVKRKKLI